MSRSTVSVVAIATVVVLLVLSYMLLTGGDGSFLAGKISYGKMS